MGSGFSKMKKQARLLEQQFSQMKEEQQKISVEGTSGAGLVKITINGDKEIKSIQIKPECVDPNDVEGLQDLIKAAFEDASKKLQEQNPENNLPGLPFSF
jgi:DNA-binding YbaB/EbfC family protein